MKPFLLRLLVRLALVVLAVFCMAPGCSGDVLKDSTFRLWCGDSLCDWKVDVGHVRRAPTWHPDDWGVELVDTPSQISQYSDNGSSCMEFTAMADVDAAAQVKVQVDFNGDGVPDVTSDIGETHWHQVKTMLRAPNLYGKSLDFIVRKQGVGRAVLVEMRLQQADGCGPPVPIQGAAVGVSCKLDSECATGFCCGAGTIVGGTCAPCCLDHRSDCAAGATCGTASPDLDAAVQVPLRCDPGLGHGIAGAPCVGPSDCTSHACDGAYFVWPQGVCGDGGVPLDAGWSSFGSSTCVTKRVIAGKCR